MRKYTAVCLGLAGLIVCVALLALGTGSAGLDPATALDALFGRGESVDVMIVREWRLPRALAAVVFGAALALAGSLMQQATRNPLGSPDIVGFDTGAFTGALIAGILLGGSFATVAAGALLSGIVTAAIVFGIARASGTGSFRVVIVGIAMSAFLTSVNTWIVLAADVRVAMSASSWALGSLNDVSWARFLPAACLLLACVFPVLLLRRPLELLALGDPLARGLGGRPERTRVLATGAAVLLSATVVTVCGPIAFVALASPQLSALMTGRRGFSPAATALTGAALLSLADLIALRLIPNSPLPVGAVTVTVGGAYLIALIAVGAKRRRVTQ